MNVLSIGNSFSQDAHRYLHALANAQGDWIECVNLYIGGCSLYTHFINLSEAREAYDMEINGKSSGRFVSIQEALATRSWDVVTLQQVSSSSFCYESYMPYLKHLGEYVRRCAPGARLLLHQTWAYAQGSERLKNTGCASSTDMLAGIVPAYRRAAAEIAADGMIPCGLAMQAAVREGLVMHRDGFHADCGIGRYLLAATWYMTLTGKRIQNPQIPLDVPTGDEEIKTVLRIAESICL